MEIKSASLYVKIDKRGDLRILLPTDEWFTYKIRDEIDLKNMTVYQKRKLCSILYNLFAADGILYCGLFTKEYVVGKLVEAMVLFYKKEDNG